MAALAADPNSIEKTGRLVYAGELAREYGFTDVGGRQPNIYREMGWPPKEKGKTKRKR